VEIHLKELECKSCGAPLGADAISEKLALVKCNHCGCVFALETAPAAEDVEPPRREVPLPKGMEMQDLGMELRIVRSWKSWIVLPMIPFAAFWWGFLFIWYSVTSDAPLIFRIFPLIHVGAGVVLVYFILAMLLNRTTVRVTDDWVEVAHRPLPWPGSACLPADEIDQIYCCRKISRDEDSSRETYQVVVLGRSGQRKMLLSGLPDAEQGIFVEQQIEGFLGIRDQRVSDPDEVAY
jgi:hypothetical protein